MTTDKIYALACALVTEHNPAHVVATVHPRPAHVIIDLRWSDGSETIAVTFGVDSGGPPGHICERIRGAYDRFEERLDYALVNRLAAIDVGELEGETTP